MKRFIVLCSIVSLLLGIVGCGGEDENINSNDSVDNGIPLDTYLNKKFMVKIENIPMDTWTIKKLGGDEQGLMLRSDAESSMYALFLMEPLPPNQSDKFIGYDKNGEIDSLLNVGMPFIDVWLVKSNGSEIPPYRLPEIIKSMYADVDLSQSKPVAGANCTGYRVTGQLDADNIITICYFTKKDILLMVYYIVQNTKYDLYVSAYDNVVKNLTLMGQ